MGCHLESVWMKSMGEALLRSYKKEGEGEGVPIVLFGSINIVKTCTGEPIVITTLHQFSESRSSLLKKAVPSIFSLCVWIVFIGVATLVNINDLILLLRLKLGYDTDILSYTRENALRTCTSINT